MFDLYHSIYRVNKRIAADEVPCILPNSQLFLVEGVAESGRLLTPPELLALLGLDLQAVANVQIKSSTSGGFSWPELCRLAGNAFSGWSFMAVAAASLLILSSGKGRSQEASSQLQHH